LIPTATDFDLIDEFIKVTDDESAHTARELAHTEGLFAGYTSGAVVQAVKQLNQKGIFKPNDLVILIFPDHGSRYMSKVYNDQWMEDQGFFDKKNEAVTQGIEFIK
jgi:cystathionine beta-synthase